MNPQRQRTSPGAPGSYGAPGTVYGQARPLIPAGRCKPGPVHLSTTGSPEDNIAQNAGAAWLAACPVLHGSEWRCHVPAGCNSRPGHLHWAYPARGGLPDSGPVTLVPGYAPTHTVRRREMAAGSSVDIGRRLYGPVLFRSVTHGAEQT